MTEYEISAAIGFYRQGASFELIALILDKEEGEIRKVIKQYLKWKK